MKVTLTSHLQVNSLSLYVWFKTNRTLRREWTYWQQQCLIVHYLVQMLKMWIQVDISFYRVSQKSARRLIWRKLKITVFTRSAFIFSESSYLKFGIKQSKIGWKLAEQWLPKGKILGPGDQQTFSQIFRKMHQFKSAILPYLSSLERKNFVNLKETQLFYLVIKLMKHFTVPRTCTGWKTKTGIGIIFCRAENYTDYREFSVRHLKSISNKDNYKTFLKGPPASLLHCIENILSHSSGKCHDSPTNGCSEFHQWLLWVSPSYNIYSLVSPQQQRNYQLEKKMIPIPLLVFHLVQALGTVKDIFH